MATHKPQLCSKCNRPLTAKLVCPKCKKDPTAKYNPYDLWHRNDEAARIVRGPDQPLAGGYIRGQV